MKSAILEINEFDIKNAVDDETDIDNLTQEQLDKIAERAGGLLQEWVDDYFWQLFNDSILQATKEVIK